MLIFPELIYGCYLTNPSIRFGNMVAIWGKMMMITTQTIMAIRNGITPRNISVRLMSSTTV